jgi:hypothetical protein
MGIAVEETVGSDVATITSRNRLAPYQRDHVGATNDELQGIIHS